MVFFYLTHSFDPELNRISSYLHFPGALIQPASSSSGEGRKGDATRRTSELPGRQLFQEVVVFHSTNPMSRGAVVVVRALHTVWGYVEINAIELSCAGLSQTKCYSVAEEIFVLLLGLCFIIPRLLYVSSFRWCTYPITLYVHGHNIIMLNNRNRSSAVWVLLLRLFHSDKYIFFF